MHSGSNTANILLSPMVCFLIASVICIYSPRIASIIITKEVPLLRAGRYLETGNQDGSFCDGVTRRDRRCVITDDRVRVAQVGRWRGFDTCHVFPLTYKGNWKEIGYDGLSNPFSNESDVDYINSVRGGILLNCTIHRYFDAYEVTINPDVGMASSSSFRS